MLSHSVAMADAVGGTEINVPGSGATVTEEVLEILRQSGTISESKYEELSRRAKAEDAADAKPKKDPDGWTVRWKNGTRIESNDGDFKIKFGGRLMLDFAQIWADNSLERAVNPATGSGVEVRRARLFVSGTLYDRFIFRVRLRLRQCRRRRSSRCQGLVPRSHEIGARWEPCVLVT